MSASRRSTVAYVELVVLAVVVTAVAALVSAAFRGDSTTGIAHDASAPVSAFVDEQRADPVQAWATTAPGAHLPLSADTTVRTPDRRIVVDSAATAQRWVGIGAALTDASAELLAAQPGAVEWLFGDPSDGGAGLDLVRLPLSATDFSTNDWTWQLAADGSAEPPEQALTALEVLDRIELVQPAVGVYAAAWTSPNELRSDPTARGGHLRADAVEPYGDLIAAQVDWLVERGVDLRAVSLGNEPGHVDDYPTLGMSDEQMVALARRLAQPLDEVGVDLLALDHNWADAERAAQLVEAAPFDGAAFHCYDGEPAAMTALADPIVTECSATTGEWAASVGWMARELVGESVRAGSTGVFTWNLALDPQNGPKAAGGCVDCRGLVTIDTASGTIEPTPEFEVLRHLATAADPGAVVLATERLDAMPVVAFANPDGTVGVFAHNDTPTSVSVELVVDGRAAQRFTLEPWSLFSARS